MAQSRVQLAKLLDDAYRAFHSETYRELDPIHVVHEYQNRQDQEIVAFLAALLSYGNVTRLLKVFEKPFLP